MGKLLATIALASAPMSIGMGYVIAALFPMMSANIAGLVGGAITVPALMFITAVARDV